MQAQLQELESKILAHVAEMQGRTASEAAASLGRTLQKAGVIGVTEEVRNCAPDSPGSLPPTHTLFSSLESTPPHCQLPMFQDPGDMQEAVMFALRLVWEGGGMPGCGTCAWTAAWYRQRRGQPVCPRPGPQPWRCEGGRVCVLSQLLWVLVLGGTPHCQPGPEALQRGPHRDGGLRAGIGRCVRCSPPFAEPGPPH